MNNGKRWSEQDITLLNDNYPIKGGAYCAELLGRTVASVNKKASLLNIEAKYIEWKPEEESILVKYFSTNINICISLLPNRSFVAINHRANYLGLKKPIKVRSNNWSIEEEEVLLKYYATRGPKYCDEKLKNRTLSAIYAKARVLGLKSEAISFGRQKLTHIEYENKLIQKDAKARPVDKYIDTKTPILHECVSGHRWKVPPHDILQGKGCPTCSNHGFDLDKPAILYYIKIETDNEKYYKIGITNNSVNKRFAKDRDKKITILLEEHFSNGKDAKDKECHILNTYKDKRADLQSKFLKSKGNTELFIGDILNLDV